jgi:hypothetical protein
MQSYRNRIALSLLALSLAVTGCDWIGSFFAEEKPIKPKVTEKKRPEAEKKTEETTPKPEAALPRKLQLGLSPPIEVNECLIKLTAAAGNVPAILQIATYADKHTESYPSVFIQAEAPTGKLTDLKDQPLAAKVFVARSASGPFFSTPEGQLAQLTITGSDAQHVKGTIENAVLLDQASGQSATVSGTFDGKSR